jgi:group I intron endonuclease
MNIYSIYKATNLINNKVYIGYTFNFNIRYKQHKNHSETGTYPFYQAIREFGWNNFQWDIIYQTKDINHCKDMEDQFIVDNNSYIAIPNSNGYNYTIGRYGKKLLSEKYNNIQYKQIDIKNDTHKAIMNMANKSINELYALI